MQEETIVWQKINNWLKKYIGLELRSPAHWIAGLLSAISVVIHPVLPICGCVLFIIYEVSQDWKSAYRDALEFMIAFFGGIILLWIERILNLGWW